jgi:hypothetical protein
LSDPQPTPQTHRAAVRVKPLYLVLGGIALVAVAVLGIVLFSGNGNGSQPSGSDAIPPTAGVFSFHIDPPQALVTAAGASADKANKAAKPAASAAEKIVHDFYVRAYLDPTQWTGGAYANTFDAFSAGAKAQAMKQLDVMTAGTAASDTFSSIKEKEAHLKEKVLMDPAGQPNSVVAVVTFEATAALKDGTSGTLTSQGQYILEKVGSGWQITAFSVTRTGQKSKAPGGTGTATATATSS